MGQLPCCLGREVTAHVSRPATVSAAQTGRYSTRHNKPQPRSAPHRTDIQIDYRGERLCFGHSNLPLLSDVGPALDHLTT